MNTFDQSDLQLRYELFKHFALEDQRSYYRFKGRSYREAARQVNTIRALLALLTGLASACAILVVSLDPQCAVTGIGASIAQVAGTPADGQSAESAASNAADASAQAGGCSASGILIGLLIVAVVAPAMGGAFSTLSDLYQWDRLINVYDSALENLEVADAASPLEEMEPEVYGQSLRAYVAGTLSVMRDETAQWGQLIRTPSQLQQFVTNQIAQASSTNDIVTRAMSAVTSTFTDEMGRVRQMLEENEKRLQEIYAQFASDEQRPNPVRRPPAPPAPGS
jgi:hypothetical protein